jgi:hypothetical protein
MFWSRLPTKPPSGIDLRDCREIYRHGSRRVYDVRGRYILKRTRYSKDNSEVATHKYIGRNSNVPVPYVYGEWTCPDRKYHYILEGRVSGYTLADCWHVLSFEAKISIARQVARYMASLARLSPSNRMETVSGKRRMNNCFNPRPRDARGYLAERYSTDREIFDNEFKPSLQAAGVPRETIRLIKETMPRVNGRMVLTHCDLYVGNVMVDPDRALVTGIIDWESGGFWPEWFQYARITHGCSDDDGEWKYYLSMLSKAWIKDAEHGRVWYDMVTNFMYDPNDAKARAWLRLLMLYLEGRATTDDLDNYKNVVVVSTGYSRWAAPEGMLNNRGGRGVEGYYSMAFSRGYY